MVLYVETIEDNNFIILLVHKWHGREFIGEKGVVGKIQAAVVIKHKNKAADTATATTDKRTRDNVLE